MTVLVGSTTVLAVGGWTGALIGLSTTAFGLMFLYLGLFTDLIDDIAKARRGIGLPEDRKGQKFAAAIGGAFFAVMGLVGVAASLFDQ